MGHIKRAFLEAAAVVSLLAGCISNLEWSREEIGRVASPDSVVDAVLVRANAGATTAFIYEVYVVPAGGGYSNQEPVFNAEHVDSLTVRWRKPRLLEVGFREATIFHFTNMWSSKDVKNFRYVTEILLRPTTSTRSLSVYNRSTEDKSDTTPSRPGNSTGSLPEGRTHIDPAPQVIGPHPAPR